MKAFTLVETLIFVTILSVFFVIAAAVSVSVIRDMKFNEAKIIATRYGEEMNEWLRMEKEINGQDFINKSNHTYCFNDNLSFSTDWPPSGQCNNNDYSLVGKYKREVTLETNGDEIESNVTVSWHAVGETKQVIVETIFTLWQ